MGLDVPMVTVVKDGRYVDDRSPYELMEEAGTPIWLARLAEFGFLDSF